MHRFLCIHSWKSKVGPHFSLTMLHTRFLVCIFSAGCGKESKVVLTPGFSRPRSALGDCMIQQLAVIWFHFYPPPPSAVHTDMLTVSLAQLESCDQHAASYFNVFLRFLCTEILCRGLDDLRVFHSAASREDLTRDVGVQGCFSRADGVWDIRQNAASFLSCKTKQQQTKENRIIFHLMFLWVVNRQLMIPHL